MESLECSGFPSGLASKRAAQEGGGCNEEDEMKLEYDRKRD